MTPVVLLVENKGKAGGSRKGFLQALGYQVKLCSVAAQIDKLITAHRPAIVFINSEHTDYLSTSVYNNLLDNVSIASIPLVYTLSENDVYLVNRKRTASRNDRDFFASSVAEACNLALQPPASGRNIRRVRSLQLSAKSCRA
ncbi:MAG: hypothetical protein EOP49_11500 [Sphingobacteriales bacterium]|nr:MAG: hypothetical protein EOP49_11500 [Sphingobacteriales bacterium]